MTIKKKELIKNYMRKLLNYFIIVFLSSLVTLFFMRVATPFFSSEQPDVVGEMVCSVLDKTGLWEGYCSWLLQLSLPVFLVCILIFLLFFVEGKRTCEFKNSRTLDFIFRNRFPIAVLTFIILVTFEINGTSLYMWTYSQQLHGGEVGFPLFGYPRYVRSDEYGVWSIYAISQGYINWNSTNTLLEGGVGVSTLWESIGGIPAWNVATLLKPFYWGFLLLGTSRGFSWLWEGRWIALFLVSFEFAMVYTKKDKALSLAAAMMMTLSPAIQWFYSQSISEVLIFGQGILLAVYYLTIDKNAQKKWWISVLLAWCIGCYVMIGYPGWLVSVSWVLTAIIIAIIIKNGISSEQLLPTSVALVGIIVYLAAIILSDIDTLKDVSNSVYPGDSNVFCGGGLLSGDITYASLYSGLYSLFIPFKEAPMFNQSEFAGFITFAPAGIILCIIGVIRDKKIDPLSAVLILVETFYFAFAAFGFPIWLAKVFLLTRSSKLQLAVGFCDAILLFRGLANQKENNKLIAASLTILCTVLIIGINLVNFTVEKDILVIMTLIGLIIFYLIFTHKKRLLTYSMLCFFICAGAFVNPLQKGIDCIIKNDVVQMLISINDDEDSIYAVEGGILDGNIPLIAGKKCFNSTQVYPNVERWKELDIDGTYENVYNRYFNNVLEITNDETSFELISFHHVKISLNEDDAKKLGIKYLLTKNTKDEYPLINEADGWKLYEVI